MKPVSIVTPWKISNSVFSSAVASYFDRLKPLLSVNWIVPTKSSLNLSQANEFLMRESQRLISSRFALVFLDEHGQQWSTPQWAQYAEQLVLSSHQGLGLVLGGAYGLPAELASLSNCKAVSLSSLTLCHELAFVTLLEQLYRICQLRVGHPYHHGGASPFILNRKTRQ